MDNNNPLGLYRHMSYEQRQDLERELRVSFADIYDCLHDLQFEAHELEDLLNRTLNGSDCGGTR